jgi:hypothetical protein
METRIAHPHALSVVSRYQEELEASTLDGEGRKKLVEVKAYVIDERRKHREVLRLWIQQAQGLLLWLVDR